MNYFICICSIIVLCISYRLFKNAAGTLSLCRLNTVSYVFYYSILISTFLGSVICALGYGDDHWILCYTKRETRVIAWLTVCYSIIAIPLGMRFVNRIYHIGNIRKLYEDFITSDLHIRLSNKKIKKVLFLMCIFSVLISIYIRNNSGSWPLFTALIEQDYLGAREERIDVRRNFHGIIYIKNLGGLCLVPLFSYFSYIILINKKNLYNLCCYSVILLCTLFVLSYDTQKAPLIFYLVGYIIIYTLISGPIKRRTLIGFVGVSLFLMSLMYVSFNATSNGALDVLLDPTSSMWGRMFISSYAGVPLSFEWFPDVIKQPTWQIGLPEFVLKAFGLPTMESARLMMLKIEPSGNLISSYFIAEAWANYGIFGVIFSPFVIGFCVQFIHLFLLRHRKDPIAIAFYAFMTTRWVISSGFVNYLYFKAILIPLVLYLIIRNLLYK